MISLAAALAMVAASFTGMGVEHTTLELQSEGNALGLGPAARSAAVHDAVKAMVIARLEALAPTRDFSAFASIIERADAYVLNCRVIEETTSDDSTHVEIAADLLDARLKADAAALVLSGYGRKPRIVLLVSERIAPGEPRELTEPGVAETAIEEELRRARLEVYVSQDLLGRAGVDELMQCLAGSPELAGQLARSCLADIAILGTATTRAEQGQRPSASGLKRVHATLHLRVIRAADGYILDEVDSEAELLSEDPEEGGILAIKDACEKVTSALSNAAALGILGGTPRDKVFMTVEGLGADALLEQILQTIRTCPGVGEIKEMYASDEMVRLSIAYTGPMGAMVDALAAGRFSDYQLETHTVVDRDMTVRIRKRGT